MKQSKLTHSPRWNGQLPKVFLHGKNLLLAIGLLVVFSLLCFVSYSPKSMQSSTTLKPSHLRPPHLKPTKAPSIAETYLVAEYVQLLSSNPNIILLEPYILNKVLNHTEDEQEEFQWRFNLPQEFEWKRNSLTVAVFEDVFRADTWQMDERFEEVKRVVGSRGPFDGSHNGSVWHVFYQCRNASIGSELHLHLVVLHRVKHFVWIGAIPESVQFQVNDQYEHNPNRSYNIHFGTYASIYDPFESSLIDGISYPDDIGHFISQLPTHRYVHCPTERTTKWFSENNQTINQNKVESTEHGIVRMKALMRQAQMEFWMACGTLLGWYRQCQVTPYTTDTDFSTWSKYVRARDMTPTLQTSARDHSLFLYNRFGERMHSLEYTFVSSFNKKWEKLDMFFIYQNETHFLLPFHVPPKYAYSVYPKYSLCSVELLGYKLLAPCEPEKIIQVEYGLEWNKPVSKWTYYSAPKNIAPLRPFNFNVTQWQQFKH